MPQHTEIRIRKEALKFAAAHMTVFPDGTKEALHGHQYQPTLTVRVKEAGFKKMMPFSDLKLAMKKIAKLWDEKVLLAVLNPHYEEVRHSKESLEFKLCGKRYLLPADEVVCLRIENVTCEELAQAYFEFLKAELESVFKDKNFISAEVYIEESPGQGASFYESK